MPPTAPPVIAHRGATGGRGPRPGKSEPADDSAAARLIAQQAMDEARLGVADRMSRTKRPSRTKPWSFLLGRGGGSTGNDGGGGGSDDDSSEDEGAGWCGICSDDAVFRCPDCEAEFGEPGGGAELFCAPCFNKEHGSDPEIRGHRAQGLSRARGSGGDIVGGQGQRAKARGRR